MLFSGVSNKLIVVWVGNISRKNFKFFKLKKLIRWNSSRVKILYWRFCRSESANSNGLGSKKIGWGGKRAELTGLFNLGNRCLKGNVDSRKTTSIETKQDFVAKS